MKKLLIVVFLIPLALPAFADDYAGIQAKQYKVQLSMIAKIYDDTHKKFGYETRVSTWLSVCGQDELSKATRPDSLALDKFIKINWIISICLAECLLIWKDCAPCSQ